MDKLKSRAKHKDKSLRGGATSCIWVEKKLSVVMAVYKNDNPEWVTLALDSVLNQSRRADEIIVVIDGPISGKLHKCLDSYGIKIIQIALPENKGLWNALNVGIGAAKHELIMRMDADDIALEDRAEKQLQMFAEDEELVLAGGQIAEFEGTPKNIISHRRVPTTHEEIVRFAKYRSPFNHPTVMFKKSAVQAAGGYSSLYRTEDYDLWVRLLMSGAKAKNTNDVLVYYRLSKANQKRKNSWTQQKESIALHRSFYKRGFLSLPEYSAAISAKMGYFLLPRGAKSFVYKKVLRRR